MHFLVAGRVRKYLTLEVLTAACGKFYNWLPADNARLNKCNVIAAGLLGGKEKTSGVPCRVSAADGIHVAW